MATYRVNYGYRGLANKLRSGSLILNAKDVKEATKNAVEQLAKEHDWFNITSCKELDSTKSLV